MVFKDSLFSSFLIFKHGPGVIFVMVSFIISTQFCWAIINIQRCIHLSCTSLVVLKNFKPREKLNEWYNERLYSFYLDWPAVNIFGIIDIFEKSRSVILQDVPWSGSWAESEGQLVSCSGEVVWYFCLFKNFPQFVVIHTVKGFSIVNEPEVDFFLNSLASSMIQWMLAIWSLVTLPFLVLFAHLNILSLHIVGN